MEISFPLFIPLLNKGDAIATPVTHFHSCIDSALFNLYVVSLFIIQFNVGFNVPIVSHCAVDSQNQTHSLKSCCSLGFWITWGRKPTTLGSWLGSKSLSVKTFPKSFPLNSYFGLFPPKIPTGPKPSHSSELSKFIVKSNQSLWDSVALAHFQQNSVFS